MAQKGRYFRPRDKGLAGTPYDSMLEKRLHENKLKASEHHAGIIAYTVPHKYHPDFVVEKGDMTYLIEAKGYFQERPEASKYGWIRKALEDSEELVFIFEKENVKLPWSKPRMDGTRMTHEDWCNKHKFRYFYEKTFDISKL